MDKKLFFTTLILAVVFSTISLIPPKTDDPVLGSFSPSGGGTYRLKTSAGTTDSTIYLSSFKEPVSLISYTMSYLNSDVGYGTIDPQTSKSEFISFTGITQNADGSANLTGVSRGLSRTPSTVGCIASTTLAQTHSGQSIFILSNSPCFYGEYTNKRNNEAISGVWRYDTALPKSSLTATTSEQFTTKTYVDSVTNAGAATSTETNGGLVELATQQEMASSTNATVDRPLVIQSKYATSSPYTADIWAPITDKDGKLNQTFWRLTDPFTWGAAQTWSASSTFSLSPIIPATKTSELQLNGLKYSMPSARAASSTVLMESGNGRLSFIRPEWSLLIATTSTAAMATTTVSFAAATDLRVVFSMPSIDSGGTIAMQFNSDTGNNYSWNVSQNANATSWTNGYNSGISAMVLTLPDATKHPYITMNIINIASGEKQYTTTISASTGTNAGSYTVGNGSWNNTSQQITSIQIGCVSTCPVGTRIAVYGSTN